jgi:photosystem II stability/assembly factor-like uncharacterized protein
MKKFTLLLFAFAIISDFAYAQWYSESNIPVQTDLNSVYFIDSNHGWAVGANSILYYHDSSWTVQYQNIYYTLTSVYIVDENHGWAVGSSFSTEKGIILFYNGSNWQTQDSIAGKYFSSVCFTNSTNGWVAGSDGTLLHYDGNSWVNYDPPLAGYLSSLFFLDNNHGWLSSYNYYWNGTINQPYSIIYKYDGVSWVPESGVGYISCYVNTVSSIFMNSFNEGLAVGNKCLNNYTTGSQLRFLKYNGSSWNEDYTINLPGYDYAPSVFLTNNSNGWCAANDGNLLHYNGISWSVIQSPSTQQLNSIFFVNDKYGWIVGDNGTVLYTHNSGGYAGFEEALTAESEFSVFPNPANDKITISNLQKQPGETIISIFNVTGELVIKDKFRNQKQIQIEVSMLTKGIFIVKIQTKTGIESRKLVIQ